MAQRPDVSIADAAKQLTVLRSAERYFESLVLFALLDAGVLDVLDGGAATADEIERRLGADERTLRATLDAAVALGILAKRDEQYSARETVLDTLVRTESAANIADFVSFLHALVVPLARLGSAIRPGRASVETGPIDRLDAAMVAVARGHAREFVQRLDFSERHRLLDVGCGPAVYSFAVLDAHPQMEATLLDLPGPLETARRLARERGLEARLEFVASDVRFFQRIRSFDVVLVSQLLHMLSADEARDLLNRSHAMLVPGGRVIIQAQFLNDDRVSPRWPALLNLIEAVITPGGRNHTVAETSRWLAAAGFENVRHIPFAAWNPSSCLVGEVPEAPASPSV